MAKRPVFGKVIAYQCNGKLYKSKERFLDAAVLYVYRRLEQSTGLRHMDEEEVSWYNTQRVCNMNKRREHIEVRICRRLEQIMDGSRCYGTKKDRSFCG